MAEHPHPFPSLTAFQLKNYTGLAISVENFPFQAYASMSPNVNHLMEYRWKPLIIAVHITHHVIAVLKLEQYHLELFEAIQIGGLDGRRY